MRSCAKEVERPDSGEHVPGSLEDRGYGLDSLPGRARPGRGPAQYAVIENARRARLAQSRSKYAAAMGALFSPLTVVAAGNPYAAAPVVWRAAELVAMTEANRMIADP